MAPHWTWKFGRPSAGPAHTRALPLSHATPRLFRVPVVTPARRPSGDEAVPRFLPDRRSGADRRRERQELYDLAIEYRRRTTDPQTQPERRRPSDRRRPPAAQFSWEDTLQIHRMLADPGMAVACPRCDGALLLGPAVPRGGVHTREVHCTGCRYSVAVVEDGTAVGR
jgi:hypothetical protein